MNAVVFFFPAYLLLLMFMFRGFPVWLKYVPGISFRTDNEPFKVFVLVLSFITSILLLIYREWGCFYGMADGYERVYRENSEFDEEP